MSVPDPGPLADGQAPLHVGIATADLDRAMVEIGALFGTTWQEPKEVDRLFATIDGTVRWSLRRVHSTPGPMRLELLEGCAGSVWATTELAQLHHYAYRAEDLQAAVERWREAGYSVEVTAAGGGGRPVRFAYLTRDGSPRIELIEGSAAP